MRSGSAGSSATIAFVPLSTPTAAELVAGPRGRRLCWELLDAQRRRFRGAGVDLASVRQCVEQAVTDLGGDQRESSVALFKALRRSVDAAMYWQPPDDDDALLRDPDLSTAIAPVAEALLQAAPTNWWATPIALDEQRYLRFLSDDDDEARPPLLSGARGRLQAWRVDQQRRNSDSRKLREGLDPLLRHRGRGRARPAVVPATDFESTSGTWWSTPDRWDVPVTTRDLAGTGPIGLWLMEDFHGWNRAACWPVAAGLPVRIFEVNDPQSWADLVERHPLDVTDSRWPDWKRTTGRVGSWLIPDWSSVSDEFDAIHVTVYGYLTVAGSAVSVGGDSATLMAGWAPDETVWLTDVLGTNGPAITWTSTHGANWELGGPSR